MLMLKSECLQLINLCVRYRTNGALMPRVKSWTIALLHSLFQNKCRFSGPSLVYIRKGLL